MYLGGELQDDIILKLHGVDVRGELVLYARNSMRIVYSQQSPLKEAISMYESRNRERAQA
jgi:hypothetical protein